MEKVDKTDGCWNWNGSKSGSGYGQFWDGKRNIPAHWFLLPLKPEKGLEACHHCDNKLCVRPSHVFLGTRSLNMQDCVLKGRLKPHAGHAAMLKTRNQRGQRNHEVKLTDKQARIAKACPKIRGAVTALANNFGVSLTVISDIRAGKRWCHLPKTTQEDTTEALAFLKTLNLWREE